MNKKRIEKSENNRKENKRRKKKGRKRKEKERKKDKRAVEEKIRPDVNKWKLRCSAPANSKRVFGISNSLNFRI